MPIKYLVVQGALEVLLADMGIMKGNFVFLWGSFNML